MISNNRTIHRLTMGVVTVAVVFLVSSCVSVTRPVGTNEDLSRFSSLSASVDLATVAQSYHDTAYYDILDRKQYAHYMKWGTFRAPIELQPAVEPYSIPFDGEVVFFPFHVIHRMPVPTRDRYKEPEYTVIGAHVLGLNLRDGSTYHGPGELSDYPGTPLIETSVRNENTHAPANYPGWITDRTRIRNNQEIYYHPGRRETPIVDRMLPSLSRYTSIDRIPMHVLRYENGADQGFHYEAVNLEHGLFVGVSFDYNGWGEFLFLSFESPAAMVTALEGDLHDIDGYHLVTGLNSAGYRRDGTDAAGGRFIGRLDDEGPEGIGAYITPEGERVFGMYQSGALNGPAVTFHDDERRSYGIYTDGELVSELVRYSPDDDTFVEIDPGTGEALGSWQPPSEALGQEWVAFDGDYETAGIAVDGDMFLHTLDQVDSAGDPVVTISSVDGNFLTGPMEDGRIRSGSLFYSDGRRYTGEVDGFEPAGRGVLQYPGGFQPIVGRFSGTDDGAIEVEETIVDVQIAYPVASEVELRGEFLAGDRIPLERGDSVWNGTVAIGSDEPVPYSVYVNGNRVSDEALYPASAEGEEYDGLLDAQSVLADGFTSPQATLSARVESRPALPPGIDPDEGARRRAEREAAVDEYLAALQDATRSYRRRAEAIRAQIQQERADNVAAVMATAVDVLEESGYVDTTDPGINILAGALREQASRTDWYDDVRYQVQFQAAVEQGDYRRAKDLSIARMRENGGDPEVIDFLDTVSDVAFDSYEAAVAAQEAEAARRAAARSAPTGAQQTASGQAIDIRSPAWTDKPTPSPNEVQLHTIVQAADHYYARYRQAAQSGNADAAEQLWTGHTASVSRAESLAAAMAQ